MLGSTRYPTGHRTGFATREQLLEYFDECLRAFEPPLRTGVCVICVTQLGDDVWEVETENEVIEASAVIICVGAMSSPRLPASADLLPVSVPQLHSSAYRSPDQIATRSVLVVGAGSSGTQISRLLSQSGRFDRVHLSVSKVLVLPRSVMGIQVHRFIHYFRLFDVRTTSPLGRLMYSGLESRGDPIMPPDPGDLARVYGVKLHDRVAAADERGVIFSDGEKLTTDELTIIWCTGFRSEFSFVSPQDRPAAFDPAGRPIHRRGVVDGSPGLYFVGLRYQHTVASHDIYGVGADARYVADHVHGRLVVRSAA
jgi:putative flavoprotein involved in K+ transport